MPGAAAEPLLDVVFVVCDGCREHVRACLSSLAEAPLERGAAKVHVVDNASSDGTREVVQAGFPWVDYRRLPRNAGFSAANNVALRRSGAPYVLLLNPDTEVRPGTLEHMLALMEERPDAAVAGCRLVDRDGAADHNAKRTFPTPASALRYFAASLLPARLRPASPYQTPGLAEDAAGEVDAVSGAFMLVRRRALDEVGLLDEGYWLYGEDLDLCYRLKRAGWKVLYDGRVTTLHLKGGTSGRRRPLRQNLAFHRSMGRFYRKFQAGRRPWLDAAVYGAIAARLALSAGRAGMGRRAGKE